MKKTALNKILLSSLLILFLAGIGLRCYKLFNMPGGMLNCNGTDLNIAFQAFHQNNYPLYVFLSSNQVREALHGYIQHLLPVLGANQINSQKIYAFILSIVCILLLFYLIKLSLGLETAFISTIMILFNFWHLYSSRILASFNGVIFFILISTIVFLKILALLEKGQTENLKRWLFLIILINILGFFYYVSFRIVVLNFTKVTPLISRV